ncbi:UNVERIFIED_CONTAM: ATPase subunit of ABC transporter with duplicated ATPase domains [Streptomyces graminofaciens]
MAVNLVNVEAVSKVYGTRALLDGVSLGVSEGDRIGVVGRNGDGKTTLIRMLAKLEEPDTGRVTQSGGLRLGVLTQHDSLDPEATIRHEVIGDLADHEWAGNAKIRDVLTGLFDGLDLSGFPQGLDTVIGPLSGGERRRIALAKLLIAEQDLIVLDEPTNHLDVEGIAWLARHLQTRRSALVCVTHDRWFLDQVCTRMWDVQRGDVYEYEGGYSDYVFARAERERIARDRGDQAAEPDAQGAGLAAARRPRPYVQAPLPHRGGERADRRRAAAA